MSERSELRRRREERMENGVKNLKEARLFPKTFLQSQIWRCFPQSTTLLIREHPLILFLSQFLNICDSDWG
jgi:hypothetical protein